MMSRLVSAAHNALRLCCGQAGMGGRIQTERLLILTNQGGKSETRGLPSDVQRRATSSPPQSPRQQGCQTQLRGRWLWHVSDCERSVPKALNLPFLERFKKNLELALQKMRA
ncbi:hypothetical protein AOLI_G00283250 [Acnodon oligacanthus]